MRHFVLLAASLASVSLQAADPALLNLVMPDAKVLAGINVQKAKTTQFGQFLLTQMPVGDSLNGFIASTGFDPRQDLTEVLMASNGAAQSSGLVLARGTFNPAQIAAALAKDGQHTSQTYKGAQLITGTAADTGAVAFLSGTIAVAGDVASVKGAIDRSSGNNAIDPSLSAKAVAFSATDAWSVSIAPLSMPGASGANNPLGGALKSIQQASGSIMLSSQVEISAQALADNDQDATSLSDVLKFVVSMMQGQQGQAGTPSTLLNSLNVTTDHSTINLQLTIPEDQLEKLIQSMKSGSDTKVAKKRVAAHV